MSRARQTDTISVSIPWGAWCGDRVRELTFPRAWKVHVNAIADAPEIDGQAVQRGIQNPIGTKPLRQLASGKQTVAIAVEDISRPCELEKILDGILKELFAAGVSSDSIFFQICNGAHAPMLKRDVQKKLGMSAAEKFLVLNHNPYENLCDTGIVLGETPVRVNRSFHEADLKIAVGSVVPHNFAGFSAGAKLILPGLADIATLERTHKYVMMGFRGGVNDVETNKFRSEIEDVVKRIGLDFFVGVVPNSLRKISGVFAGNVVFAHRKGVEFARRIYKTTFEPLADIAVLNAYPKDAELLQADAAVTPLKTGADELVKENGVLIIASNCSNGFGYHGLFGPGMRLSRKPIKKRFLKGKDLILFSPNANQAEFRRLYWEGYLLMADWDAVIIELERRFSQNCRISVFPTAPLQLLQ
jgi:nickel-dependent lactate racemase